MHKLTIEELHRISAEEFQAAQKLPVVVVLDNVRSMHNIGSVFRTADAFRVARICLCGITACPPNNEIHKTALGAEDSVAWKYYESTLQAIDDLRREGYYIYCIEQVAESTKLDALLVPPQQKLALVFGHEVKGVDAAVANACDAALEIQQLGTKHSLNVSVSAGIVLWEFARQLQYTKL